MTTPSGPISRAMEVVSNMLADSPTWRGLLGASIREEAQARHVYGFARGNVSMPCALLTSERGALNQVAIGLHGCDHTVSALLLWPVDGSSYIDATNAMGAIMNECRLLVGTSPDYPIRADFSYEPPMPADDKDETLRGNWGGSITVTMSWS